MLLVYRSIGPGAPDGVRDYAENLCAAMEARGHPSDTIDLHGIPYGEISEALAAAAEGHRWTVVQYVPQAYGRLGVAPTFVTSIAQFRRRSPGSLLGLMVHEPFVRVERGRPSHYVLSPIHRIQLTALRRLSHTTLATTPQYAELTRGRSGAPVAAIGVGSNLPDQRAERAATRRNRGWTSDVLVVGSFSTGGNPEHAQYVAAAVRGIREASGKRVVVVTLGAGAPTCVPGEAGVEEIRPGALPAEDVASLLAACDVFLAPYADGISARRTTVMAALQHGVRVLATDGVATDASFRGVPDVTLTEAGNVNAFGVAAGAMTTEAVTRPSGASGSRTLFDARYSWDSVSERLVAALMDGS